MDRPVTFHLNWRLELDGQAAATELLLYCPIEEALELARQLKVCGVNVRVVQGINEPAQPAVPDPEPPVTSFASILKGKP